MTFEGSQATEIRTSYGKLASTQSQGKGGIYAAYVTGENSRSKTRKAMPLIVNKVLLPTTLGTLRATNLTSDNSRYF